MPYTPSSPAMTMRAARDAYFVENHFGADGGYNDPWVDLSLGPIPVGFPNVEGRKQAVKVHDLHHILTGYNTDWGGEFEISAWEIGAGCKRMLAAWVINLMGYAAGALFFPRRTFAAFVRGRRSRSLYGEAIDELLDLTVAEARQKMAVPTTPVRGGASDLLLHLAAATAGLAMGVPSVVVLGPPFVIVGAIYRWTRRRAKP